MPLEPDEVKQVRSDDYLWRPAFPLLVHLVTGKCFKQSGRFALSFWHVSVEGTDKSVDTCSNRIPTVKLKIPGKAFLKSEFRTSVTFKL